MKKGQISIEVIYAIGVMVIIFTIVSGLSFTKRIELRKIDEYVSYRSECLKLSDYISGVMAGGDQTQVKTTIKNQVNISSQGIIEVAVTENKGAVCVFNAKVGNHSLNPGVYTIKNEGGLVLIT